jgi:hypothetical protein
MKSKTFNDLLSQKTLLIDENSRLSNELGTGNTIHSFMHYPWNATTAPKKICDFDTRDARHNQVLTRLFDAFAKILSDSKDAGHSMWTDIEAKHGEFLSAVKERNYEIAGSVLAKLFQSELIWGLGKYDTVLLSDVLCPHDRTHVQLRITDAIVSLGQAIGAARLTSIEQQGIEPHLKVLKTNLEELLKKTESFLEFELSSPPIAGAYGCEIGGKFITLDGVINAYVAHRLKQLGAGKDSSIVEIGGGFGCLAEIVQRAIGCRYVVYDLPWVTLIQAYCILMALPLEQSNMVRLYGEDNDKATIEILPFWSLEKQKEKSIDFVINSDSIPEMSREAALSYIKEIGKKLRGKFLSVNQEAGARNSDYGNQNCVLDIVRSVGKLKLTSRQIYWMRQGYVEEVFEPV